MIRRIRGDDIHFSKVILDGNSYSERVTKILFDSLFN